MKTVIGRFECTYLVSLHFFFLLYTNFNPCLRYIAFLIWKPYNLLSILWNVTYKNVT